MSKAIAFLSVMLLALAQPAGAAEPVRQKMEFRVSLAGFSVAMATFETRIDRRRYHISGKVHSAGIARLFSRITAETTVSGLVQAGRARALSYDLVYTRGERTRTYTVGFRNGNVVETSITPAPRRPESWVPVTARHLRAVFDPISGLLLPPGARSCAMTRAIYDGETRMDLVLSDKGTRPYRFEGFSGDTLVCSVRFVPKAGYKPESDDIAFLRRASGMEIWFARTGAVDFYAPVYVRVPTRAGALTIAATRLQG